MNLKKKMGMLLGTLFLIFIFLSIYFHFQYKSVEQQVIRILEQEITQQNPQFGYTFSSSLEGELKSHSPIDKLEKNSIDFLFDSSSKAKIIQALNEVKDKNSLFIKDVKDRHDHPIHLYLKRSDDTLRGLIFFPNELQKFTVDQERHYLILLSLSLLFALCCIPLLTALFFTASTTSWWICIGIISSLMVGEIGYLWSLRNSVGFSEDLNATPVLSKEQEENFFHNLYLKRNQSFLTVPTGVFIHNGQFSLQGVSDIYPGVFLSGYIWQRYSLKNHTTLERDVIVANAHYFSKKKLYHHTDLDNETICWSFDCSLYQKYNSLLYPFDHRHITLDLLHKNFENNVALVPDLESYDSIDSLMLPGLSLKTLQFSHWNISKSFFSFNFFNFKTDLGLKSFEYNQIPYLQYIITMQRKLGGSFLMYIILFLVVLIILFVLLTAFLRQGTLIDIVGFSTLGVLGSCSGLLFVLITSEINLRQTLLTEGIVYLEYLYFICYLAIIGVIINSILFAKGKPSFVTYEDNLICKLLYWPLLLLLMVLVTAYALY